jgi:dihydrolipoamide dehydrogenase
MGRIQRCRALQKPILVLLLEDESLNFDLCILGAGPAGYAAAMRAHDLGKRVALVEAERIGGAGLHCGALSSKTMWHLSNDYALASRLDRGFHATDLRLRYAAVVEAVREAVTQRRLLLERQLEQLSRPGPAGGTVTLLKGRASFVTPHQIAVGDGRGGELLIGADHFLIATGSRPRSPDGIAIDGERVLTSDHIENLPDFPESMVIVGAGVIGCEYATMFANFGKTRISILDRQPRILPFEDADVAEVVAGSFEQMGVVIHRQSKLQDLRVIDDQVSYTLTDEHGATRTFHVERALISIGRVPNTADLNLAAIGVAMDRNGGVLVEQTRSTSHPHIYAAGDATMDVALANVAEMEGRHAVEYMFDLKPSPIRYEALSAIMFLNPEVASVGLNEQQAREQKIPYRVGVVANALVNRNIAMRATRGFVKLLASLEEPNRLLGLRVVGPEASSAIQGIAFLIDQGATLADIDRCVHPHPAITEGVQECARLLLGRSIHKTEVFGPELLRRAEG